MSLLDYLPRIAPSRGGSFEAPAYRPLEFRPGSEIAPPVDYQSLAEGTKEFGASIAKGISSAASGLTGGITGAPAENRAQESYQYSKELRPLQKSLLEAEVGATERRYTGTGGRGGSSGGDIIIPPAPTVRLTRPPSSKKLPLGTLNQGGVTIETEDERFAPTSFPR